MSTDTKLPGPAPSRDDPPTAPVPSAVEFHYTQTDSVAALLRQLGASLLVSTYQANKLLVVRAAAGGLSMLVRTFERPMGLAVDARRMALGTRNQVWLLRNAPDIAPRIEPAGQHDACYLPRSCHVTGDIAGHEMAWAGEELWVVNTRFSCLCTLHPDYSFVPRWQPPFITALAAEDRCHLNGLAMAARTDPVCSDPIQRILGTDRMNAVITNEVVGSGNDSVRSDPIHRISGTDRMNAVTTNNWGGSGNDSVRSDPIHRVDRMNAVTTNELNDLQPKYVTALGETDTAGGWRSNKAKGGCLIDVPSGQVIARGLSMPHSPRLHEGRLWLLESGTGQLVLIDLADGRRRVMAELPGFTRGLAMLGPYAFIGLSKIRETATFGGLPIAERLGELKCGVAVVDLRSGQMVGLLEFQTAVEEIFDVQILPGLRFPEVLGFQKDEIHHTFIVPSERTSTKV